MGHRRYFIRKDVKKAGKAREWIEMEGDEFYRFLHTKEAKGRYFIQLKNDGDEDCDVIYMEVSKPEYIAWRADFDRRRYYRKRNFRHGFILVSLSDPFDSVNERGLTIEDVTGAETPGTWERAAEEMEAEELRQAISKLSRKDRELLKIHFWDSMTQQEIADALNTSQPNIRQRLRRIYKNVNFR